jgi:Tol biopolymer transport system component
VQEAKSASSLNHPNIVTIYEIGQEPVKSASGGATDSGPLHYISMELISGKTLSAKIHEEKTDLKSLVGYLAQAAEGIAKAHAVGIVHRDLKPGNIMVTDDGYAKVLDFGLAKLTEKSSGPNEATEIADRTSEGAVMGTVSYMSPEQVQGKPVDARADIFSFGCILYEAATRQRPFTADSNVEIMHKILHEKPRPVEEINPHVPAELRRVIRRCLAKQPEQRAQSMKDIAIELREIVDEYDALSSSATSATLTPGGGVAPLSSSRRKSKKTLIYAALVVVAVAAAFWKFGLMSGGKKETATPFQNMRLTTETSRGDVLDCAISPDGRFLAYVAGKSGAATMRVRQVATGSDVEVLPVQQATLEFPCFTPDGNYLFFCRRKPDAPLYRQLLSVPSLGGQEQERGFDVDSHVAFSPDGKRVAFFRGVPQKNYTAILVLDLDTKKETQLASVPFPGGPGGHASWSPDGKTIAISVVTPPPAGGTKIRLFDATTGASRDIFEKKGLFVQGGTSWLPDGKGIVMSAVDLGSTITNQVFTLTYPGASFRRVTNDFNNYGPVSAGGSDEAIAVTRSSGLTNLYVSDVASGQERALTFTTNPEQSPFVIAVTSDRIYFTALRGDYACLLSLPVGGGDAKQISTPAGHVGQVVAANGTVVFREIGTDQQGHIYRVDGDGSKQVTTGGGELLTDISPDGSLICFARSDSSRGMWVQPVVGGDARLVSPTAVTNGGNGGGFSPDGKHLGTLDFATDTNGLIRNVFKVFNVEDAKPVGTIRLPQGAQSFTNLPPHSIAFVSRNDPHGNVFDFDFLAELGNNSAGDPPLVQLSHFTDGRVTDIVASRDGKHLAVVRRMPDGENVWVMNADGSQPKQVTHFANLDVQQIKWTPDSQRVACLAGHTGSDVALIRNFR